MVNLMITKMLSEAIKAEKYAVAVGSRCAMCGIVLLLASDVWAKTPKGRASNGAPQPTPTTPTIQQGMRLRCRFVAETGLRRKNGTMDGNFTAKADKATFQFEVVNGRLVLDGKVGIDRLRVITNVPGESAYFIEDNGFGKKTLWSFHRVETDLILAVKQTSIRDLGQSDIQILSTAANCAVTGGNGIAVTE